MPSDNLEEQIRTFVGKHLGVSRDSIRSETDIVDDLRIYGDDVWEMIEDFGKKYGVDLQEFRWYHHSGPEGCNPLWLLSKPWWARKTHVPIRLRDLVESARLGKWCVRYPESERRNK